MNKFIILSILIVLSIAQQVGQVVVVPETEEQYTIQQGVYQLNQQTFKKALQEFDFILVKFFAPWCGHCKNMAADYKQAAQTLADSGSVAKVAEVDCTQHKNLCQLQGIRGYPTLLFFKKGVEGSEKYGPGRSKDAIVAWLNEKTSTQGQEKLSEL